MFLAREIEYFYNRKIASGIAVEAVLEKIAEVQTAIDKVASTAPTAPAAPATVSNALQNKSLNDLNAELNNLLEQVVDVSVPGASIRAVRANSTGVVLKQRFERPIVIGYRGFRGAIPSTKDECSDLVIEPVRDNTRGPRGPVILGVPLIPDEAADQNDDEVELQ